MMFFFHSFTFNVVFCASNFIMCPTFVTMFYISDCHMIFIFNFGDAMFFGFEIGEGIEFDFLIKDPIF